MIRSSISYLATNKNFLMRRNFSLSPVRKEAIKSHAPDKFEKRFLVWTGKYKSVEEVPNHVSCHEMERCRNRIRIRGANIMIVLTIIGCIVSVYSGKAAAKRGESVQKMNLEWHKEYNERANKKE